MCHCQIIIVREKQMLSWALCPPIGQSAQWMLSGHFALSPKYDAGLPPGTVLAQKLWGDGSFYLTHGPLHITF